MFGKIERLFNKNAAKKTLNDDLKLSKRGSNKSTKKGSYPILPFPTCCC